jgi:outer membrane protein assembly factor BamB
MMTRSFWVMTTLLIASAALPPLWSWIHLRSRLGGWSDPLTTVGLLTTLVGGGVIFLLLSASAGRLDEKPRQRRVTWMFWVWLASSLLTLAATVEFVGGWTWPVALVYLLASAVVPYLAWSPYRSFLRNTVRLTLSLVGLYLFESMADLRGYNADGRIVVTATNATPPAADSYGSPDLLSLFPDIDAYSSHSYLGDDGARYARSTEFNESFEIPRELWRRRLLPGRGGFAVEGRFALTWGQQGKEDVLLCLDTLTGQDRWQVKCPGGFQAVDGAPAPRTTPAIYQGTAYALGSTGWLLAVDLQNGTERWRVNIQDDLTGEAYPLGLNASPLVIDDLVVVVPTSPSGICLGAYEIATGKRRWYTLLETASASSPVVATIAGQRQILLRTVSRASGISLTGEVLWSHALPTAQPRAFTSIVPMANDSILISDRDGAQHLKVRPGESVGQVLWHSTRFQSLQSTPVLLGHEIFSHDGRRLSSFDVGTGLYSEFDRRMRVGHLLATANHVVVASETGTIHIAEPLGKDPQKTSGPWNLLRPLALNPPAIAGRLLLWRNAEEAVCISLPVTWDPSTKQEASTPAPLAATITTAPPPDWPWRLRVTGGASASIELLPGTADTVRVRSQASPNARPELVRLESRPWPVVLGSPVKLHFAIQGTQASTVNCRLVGERPDGPISLVEKTVSVSSDAQTVELAVDASPSDRVRLETDLGTSPGAIEFHGTRVVP